MGKSRLGQSELVKAVNGSPRKGEIVAYLEEKFIVETKIGFLKVGLEVGFR